MNDGKDLYKLMKSWQPALLSTRVSSTYDSHKRDSFYTDGSSGDFFSCEAKTKDTMSVPWEACTSVSYPTYGFDPEAKLLSKDELVTTFDRVVCGNGNFLLNIGPDRDGSLPALLTDRFLEMSSWVKTNKAAIYNCSGGPYAQNDSIGSTYKDNKIYLHVRKNCGTIVLRDLVGYQILKAKALVSGKNIPLKKTDTGYEITPPALINDQNPVFIIELSLNKDFKFARWMSIQ